VAKQITEEKLIDSALKKKEKNLTHTKVKKRTALLLALIAELRY
jgi:hypothetical protein